MLEAIRSRGAVMLGFAESPEEASVRSQAVPKVAFVSRPQDYPSVTGRMMKSDAIDIVARIMSMGTLHKAYAVTGAICTAGAARIEGTVVHEAMGSIPSLDEDIRLGHPGGVIPVKAAVTQEQRGYTYKEAVLCRTARRLMEGYVCVPEKVFS
jgi:2-methylaconitate cis-trans-isomerase PrpF